MEHNAVELLYGSVLYKPPIHEYIHYDRGDCVSYIYMFIYVDLLCYCCI